LVIATNELSNFIDGEFVSACTGAVDSIVDPATGAEIARAPSSTREDVDRAVSAATRAFESWGRTTPQERSLALLRLADAIEENADELASLESQNAASRSRL
jgi:betaine-aldehyde dehydrogenase